MTLVEWMRTHKGHGDIVSMEVESELGKPVVQYSCSCGSDIISFAYEAKKGPVNGRSDS